MADVNSPVDTREALHTIAAHILGRRRFIVSGRFGLRASPGGIATPAFGDDIETVRLSGLSLVREVGAAMTVLTLNGSTLRRLGSFVDVNLDEPFSVGADTPALGDLDTPLDLDPATVTAIADWFALTWRALDDVLVSLPDDAEATTIQLWPEHFDAATTVTVPRADPVNLGFSPGDGFEAEPYVYVGPSSAERPGDPGFWNVPFGAMRRRSEVQASPDPAAFCRRFLTEGLRRVASA